MLTLHISPCTWAAERNTGQLTTELATSSPTSSSSFLCSLFCTFPLIYTTSSNRLCTQTALRHTISFLLTRTAYHGPLCILPPVPGLHKGTPTWHWVGQYVWSSALPEVPINYGLLAHLPLYWDCRRKNLYFPREKYFLSLCNDGASVQGTCLKFSHKARQHVANARKKFRKATVYNYWMVKTGIKLLNECTLLNVGSRDSLLAERKTCDPKVASSNPGKRFRRLFTPQWTFSVLTLI